MNCNKPCKECPWVNTNQHSIKFREYAQKMKSLGKVENHSCHMINKDVWGLKTEINNNNVCQGSKLYNKKL
jgi:Fe2+ transport system protein FeoA